MLTTQGNFNWSKAKKRIWDEVTLMILITSLGLFQMSPCLFSMMPYLPNITSRFSPACAWTLCLVIVISKVSQRYCPVNNTPLLSVIIHRGHMKLVSTAQAPMLHIHPYHPRYLFLMGNNVNSPYHMLFP